MKTIRLTMAQALIKYLTKQYVSFDGEETPFFAGCFGIFGHGNVAGVGQALTEFPELKYYQGRNEQAMVHAAIGYSKVKNRRQALVCTTSIGPGAMNMVTGAQTATINRLPVLLLPGDIFANRIPDPVLQQVENEFSQDQSANDCFKPVSRFWDRINRSDQLMASLPAAMRVLTSPSETGAVTLSLPQDVQTEAFDYPVDFFEKKTWVIPRNRPDINQLHEAVKKIKQSSNPVIIAGGGVKYSEATEELRSFAEQTGIPVGETYAGKGSVPYDAPYSLGGIGATGTKIAIDVAEKADLVIGIGTRYSDFTSASNSLFQNPDVSFININVKELDAAKRGALSLVGDAKVILAELLSLLDSYRVSEEYENEITLGNNNWDKEVSRIYSESNGTESPIHQSAVIDAVNSFMEEKDIMVCAAGSLPGDLHKLWRSKDPQNFHLEYGNSCMGYEIAGGLGAKMAAKDREVYVLVGDGSYLMLSSEIVTSIQEGIKLTIVLLDNSGYASIGALSNSIGSNRFGTRYKFRTEEGLTGGNLPVDLGKNAESLGVNVIRANTKDEINSALTAARNSYITTVIYVKTDIMRTVKGYHAWWDVPVAEESTQKEVQEARAQYVKNLNKQKRFF